MSKEVMRAKQEEEGAKELQQVDRENPSTSTKGPLSLEALLSL
jgi:hypothetical protein